MHQYTRMIPILRVIECLLMAQLGPLGMSALLSLFGEKRTLVSGSREAGL
jgi:hypothetical protein